MRTEFMRMHVDEARRHLRLAMLDETAPDLTPPTRELLEAVKHIDNARKMLREEKTP